MGTIGPGGIPTGGGGIPIGRPGADNGPGIPGATIPRNKYDLMVNYKNFIALKKIMFLPGAKGNANGAPDGTGTG